MSQHNTLGMQEADADVVHSDVARRAAKALGVTVGISTTRSVRVGGGGALCVAAAAWMRG